ncbi:TPA_exp: putative MFS transporter [Trichophyton benhamiae CBS 112371]|nr:TPA_exp: putative MFS transporter [Trichophyton benhamiae CBS 112371]
MVGVISATSGDFGPFRSVEESTISHLTTPATRTDVLSWLWFKSKIAEISQESLSVVIKLWILLTIDSLADGMVSYALTNYYLVRKFGLAESYLGDIMSICFLLMAISTAFAGPLARRLGLINTMVFTHLPSSLAVLLLPVPQNVGLTIALLFIRTGLNSMDQGPRAAFIAAVVKPGERTAVMGITAMLRTLGSTIGPSLTGFLADTDKFWIAFVVAGALRVAYDLGLFYLFVDLKINAPEQAKDPATNDQI